MLLKSLEGQQSESDTVTQTDVLFEHLTCRHLERSTEDLPSHRAEVEFVSVSSVSYLPSLSCLLQQHLTEVTSDELSPRLFLSTYKATRAIL